MTKTLMGYDVMVYVIAKTSQTMSYLHSKCHYWAKVHLKTVMCLMSCHVMHGYEGAMSV